MPLLTSTIALTMRSVRKPPELHWHPGSSREQLRTRVFTVYEQTWTCEEDGRSADFVRIDCPDWVNVIAITDDRQVVCIEQFRFGTGEVTLEIPGGVLEPDEVPVQAGVRELLEETGYSGSRPKLLGAVTTNPALQSNRCHTLLVEQARLTAKQNLDPNEQISVRLIPLQDIPRLIQQGSIHHALVVGAFHQLLLAAPHLAHA